MQTVEISLLGPVSLAVGGIAVRIGARRQRAVLAFLALHAGEPMSADRLLDAVWGDDIPDSGEHECRQERNSRS